jgi:Holliday junction resolvase RusA-like endonuclease
MISMHLPIAPVPFSRPRCNGNQFYNAPKYSKFKKQLSTLLQFHFARRKPIEGPIELRVIFHLEKPKTSKNEYPIVRPDLDNYLKSVMDAANKILWLDDCQVVRVFMQKFYSKEPAIGIFVQKYTGEENV